MHRNYYIAPGTLTNWGSAFTKGNIWGLREDRRTTWDWLKAGEIVFFYVESPRSAVVGYGEIQDTFYDRTRFFADDWGGVTEWPLRFRFRIILPTGALLALPGVSVTDMLKFPRLKRFENLTDKEGEELLSRCQAALK